MENNKIVKLRRKKQKNEFYSLKFLNFQNKIEMEITDINRKIDEINKKIHEHHLENIRSDELLIRYLK